MAPRDATHITQLIGFTCGVVMLELRSGVSSQTLDKLLADLPATRRSGFDTAANVGLVNVPVGTELKAIERAYRDPSVVRAGLNLQRSAAY